MVIATKGGLTRHGPDVWLPLGRPEYLRQCVLMSLRRLKLERIDLWQLHRIDPKVPRDEQFGVIAEMQREGLIRHVGLSEVNVEEIEAAQKLLQGRDGAEPLQPGRTARARTCSTYCEKQRHRLHSLVPARRRRRSRKPGGAARRRVAKATARRRRQVALAWVLKRSPVMLPIPGTGKVKHLEENTAAAERAAQRRGLRAR